MKKVGSGCLGAVIAIVILFVIVIAMMGSCANSVSDAIEDTENSYLDVNGKSEFSINETFENEYVTINMTEIDEDFKDYEEYASIKDGYKVLMVKIEASNVGESDEYVSSYEFNCYADDVSMEEFYGFNNNYESLSSTMSAGKSAFGYLFYEIPEDYNTVYLEYDPSWIDSNNITFNIK